MIRNPASFTIDVSRLPPPEALKDVDENKVLAERRQSLKTRFQQYGIPFDVDGLHTDPAIIVQQEDAYREVLDKTAINDSVRAVLPAFARGANLEAIVARANVQRIVVRDPETDKVTFYESDAALLQRYLAGFAAPSAGSADGYIFRAATAWPQAADVAAVNGGGGKVLIYLLGAEGTPASLDAVLTVARALQAKDARGLTDDVSVSAAEIFRYSVELGIEVPRGPDPLLVASKAEAAVRQLAADRYLIGGEVPVNAIEGAAYVPNVLRVIPHHTLTDIPSRRGVAPWMETLKIRVEIVG